MIRFRNIDIRSKHMHMCSNIRIYVDIIRSDKIQCFDTKSDPKIRDMRAVPKVRKYTHMRSKDMQ